MLGLIIKLIVVFTIGWLIYASFFGNAEEKKIAGNITSSFKGLVSGITSAIKNEADKGTFTTAFQKTSEAISSLKNGDASGEFSAKIAELEAEKQRLETQVNNAKKLKSTIDQATSDEKTKEDLKKLADKIEQVSKEMETAK